MSESTTRTFSVDTHTWHSWRTSVRRKAAALALLLASLSASGQQVALVSTSAGGAKGNGQSSRPDVSADGRFVAFASQAWNLVPGTAPYMDIFVKDLLTGDVALVSKASDGTPGNGQSSYPLTISSTGRYVAFISYSDNLVPNDTNARYDLFWHDRITGTTQMVNVADDGAPSNNYADWPAVSGDGRYVVFNSNATNLVSPSPTGTQLYVRDTLYGTTRLISRSVSGAPQGGGQPDISTDGRWVVYVRNAVEVHLVDTQNCSESACSVRRVNLDNLGQSVNGHTSVLFPKISGNGRFVSWESNASGFVASDTNAAADVFVHDTLTSTTTRVSVASDGTQADSYSYTPDITDDGRYVIFTSNATNLDGTDTNGVLDIYMHDRLESRTTRLTGTSSGGEINNHASYYARISGNGRQVVFSTNATNVVPGDTDSTEDVYVISIGPPNQSPTADAGDDIIAAVGERASLNGLLSSDAETPLALLAFHWSIESAPAGSAATLEDASLALTALTPDIPGDYILSLVASDEGGLSSEPAYVTVTAEIDPAFVFERLGDSRGDTVRIGASGYEVTYNYFWPRGLLGERAYGDGYDGGYSYDWSTHTYSETWNPSIGWVGASGTDRLVERGDPMPGSNGAEFENVWLYGRSGSNLHFYGYGRDADGHWSSGEFLAAPDGSIATPTVATPLPIAGDSEPLQWIWRQWYYWAQSSDRELYYGSKGTHVTRERTYSYPCGDNNQDTCTGTYTQYIWHHGIYTIDEGTASKVVDTFTDVPGEDAYFTGFGNVAIDGSGETVAFVGHWSDGAGRWHQGLFRRDSSGELVKVLDDQDELLRGGWFGRLAIDGAKVYFGGYGYSGGYEQNAGGANWWSAAKGGIYSASDGGTVIEVAAGQAWFARYNRDFYLQGGGYTWPDAWNYSVRNGVLAFPAWSYFYRYDTATQTYTWSHDSGTYWKENGRVRAIARSGQPIGDATYHYVWSPCCSGDWLQNRSVLMIGHSYSSSNDESTGEYLGTSTYDTVLARFDSDRDGRGDDVDNCPQRPNADQLDSDADGIGDHCEDTDLDSWEDSVDNCPVVPNNQANIDGDLPGDACDVCPLVADDQSDHDGDRIGDACDTDADNDTVADEADNCPSTPNTDQANLDTDLLGNACDPDIDGDGIANVVDGAWDGQHFSDQSFVASDDFSDHALGGRSFGQISGRGQLIILVDDASGVDQGLMVSAVNGSGSGMVKQCDFKGKDASLRLEQGSIVTVTCGSLSVRAIARGAQIILDDDVLIDVQQQAEARVVGLGDGEIRVENQGATLLPLVVNLGDDIEVSIPAASVTEIAEPEPGKYEVQNTEGSAQPISITVDGRTTEVEPGETGDVEELRDSTPPIINATVAGTLGSNGWYTTDVQVFWNVTDPQSTVSSSSGCAASIVANDTSGSVFTCSATSIGGTATESVTIKRDASAPQITVSAPAEGAAYKLNQAVAASYSCSDQGSGVATCIGAVPVGTPIDTASVGAKTFAISAADAAGNVATESSGYLVQYSLAAFQQPIDNPPIVNTVAAGRTLPVKWQLSDADGTYLSDLASFKSLSSVAVQCDTGAPVDDVEEVVAAGGTLFRYDATTSQFIYNWATSSSWKGKCRRLALEVLDGQKREANFKFR
jgi:hypothetical protein